MARALVLLLLVVAIAYSTLAHPEASHKCGPNEEFKSCGSPCVDTCEKPASPICTLRCEVGCQCKSGYVRNRQNQCVLTREC
ncbi:hypothetical protein QLX08_007092 [Tetragonisca angustula]|uniref:TIL domain-containing protein n=1 Tax=Tetragonisca angustula TaxID=166442 RepID=A0AAW0ZR04_9HYME